MKSLRVHNIEETPVHLEKNRVEDCNVCWLNKFHTNYFFIVKIFSSMFHYFLIEKSKGKGSLYCKCKPIMCLYSGENIDYIYKI